MLALDGFEEGLEVALAKALRALALDDLEEHRRTVDHRLGEELKQVAFFVAVDQDAELAQRLEVFLDFADAVEDIVVVVVRHVEELHATVLQGGHRADDVVGGDGDVLHARALVEVDVLLDLGFLAAFRRLVDRELDAAVAVAHHLGHERGVLRRNVLVVKRHELGKAHHLGVEFAPGVHLAPADVADHVVDVLEAHGCGLEVGVPGAVSGEEHAVVVLALHEDVDGVAVRFDGAEHHLAVAVAANLGLEFGHGPALGRFLKALARVRHPKRHRLHAVPVLVEVGVERAAFLERRGEDEGDFVLAQHVADAVLAAGLEAFERERLKAPRGHVVVGALLGVAHDELHVVRAEQRQEIVGFGNDFFEVGGGFGQHVFRFFVEVVKFEGVPSSRVTTSFGGSLPTRGRGLVGSLSGDGRCRP